MDPWIGCARGVDVGEFTEIAEIEVFKQSPSVARALVFELMVEDDEFFRVVIFEIEGCLERRWDRPDRLSSVFFGIRFAAHALKLVCKRHGVSRGSRWL